MAQMYKHYSLARYRGTSSKHKCPHCGQKTFKFYVDEDGIPFWEDFKDSDPDVRVLAEKVGRCDNERKCGWNYTPKQFFEETKSGVPRHHEGYKPPPPPPTAKPLKFEVVQKSFQPYRATFVQFLRDVVKLPKDRLDQTLKDYWVGASKSGRIAYWMIDSQGNCKDGKFMAYKPDGHRDHDQHPYWARKRLIQDYCKYGRISYQRRDELLDMEVIRPYFGEHLLADQRYKQKPVALVEGEKTCLICAVMYPRFLWMATGNNSFNQARLATVIFQRRKIYIFPDVDQVERWKRLAEELHYPNVVVKADYILSQAKSEKDDMGDIAMREWMEGADEGMIQSCADRAEIGKAEAMIEPTTAQAENEPTTTQDETWTAEDEARYRLAEVEIVEKALGYEEPCEPLRLLMFGLDLQIASGEVITEPDYIGF